MEGRHNEYLQSLHKKTWDRLQTGRWANCIVFIFNNAGLVKVIAYSSARFNIETKKSHDIRICGHRACRWACHSRPRPCPSPSLNPHAHLGISFWGPL